MTTKACSLAFVTLLLLSSLSIVIQPHDNPTDESKESELSDLFDGFFVGEHEDAWNMTPWPTVAVPEGFSYMSVIDYSDVGVLINNLSEESRTIGWAFVAARNISLDRVFIFNQSGTPVGETINREKFTTYFAEPFLEMLRNSSSASSLNYLVTTKGIPLRISGGADKASFDQELALLGGTYNSSIGANNWFNHGYGPLAGKEMNSFTRDEYGFFLVTRLTGYTVDTALELIERANNSLGERGTFVLDLATNRNGSGYKYWNDDLYAANLTLNGSMDIPVIFDEESEFITNISNVMGYASWGSNDGNWDTNRIPNSGFDTTDSAWGMGTRYWEHTLPAVNADESFSWNYQSQTKQGGSGALEGILDTNCSGQDGTNTAGLLAEYFDNSGISVGNTMPDLTTRQPNAIRVEPNLDWTSRGSAYPGLDSRFNTHWSGRFSGIVTVPETGNWTFYLESDDGSELWLNHSSLVQNHGMHGMRTVSNYINLTAGEHDLRVEFYQGGGPHGLRLFWEGPNQSKVIIPTSALSVSSLTVPQPEHLEHRWDFEEGTGSQTNDSSGNAHLSFYGMNSTNWDTCPGGSCLMFDGQDDYIEVDVDDWSGNFTVSQFVMTNTTNQPSYASTFASGDAAGSNASFQHMMQSAGWYLHNDQTNLFDVVTVERWAHLATVFDNGTVRQYFNGQYVGSTVASPGDFNNFDLYRMGVNRAGSSFFEGKIDRVLVYSTALSHSEVHQISREVLSNCQVYSGANQEITTIWQNVTLPENHTSHAWLLSSYGMIEGPIGGTYTLQVEARDASGTLLSTNRSTGKTFETNWNSDTLRFRPHPQAVSFNISIEVMITGFSQEGSLFLDTLKLRAIRPHMDWVNGSIAETAVSTGGRSFNWNTAYGQSLVADLIEDGVSGVKGYVYEPYLTAVGSPSVLLPAYASGYNLAESHAAASTVSGWMGVVVGDPKMAAYADLFHDINIVDARVIGDVNVGEPTLVQVIVENLGMAPSNGSLMIQSRIGNVVLNESSLAMPSGDQYGSRAILNLTFEPIQSGFFEIRIRYTNTSHEQHFGNNMISLSLFANDAPNIINAYCNAPTLTRGGYTVCTAQARDDSNVTAATMSWQIVPENESVNESLWTQQTMGKIDSSRWQATLTVPTDVELGEIALQIRVYDIANMSDKATYLNVTRIVDAPRTWYGPHVSDIDPPSWNHASTLPNKPNEGLLRHRLYTLTSCATDVDFDVMQAPPIFSSSRGTMTNTTSVVLHDANVYCYSSNLSLELGMSLEDIEIQVRSNDGSLLLERLLWIDDVNPEVSLFVADSNGSALDAVVGHGREQLIVQVSDIDDPITPFIGDVMVYWPGNEMFQIPLDIPRGVDTVTIPLSQIPTALESGELVIDITGNGLNGGTAQATLSIPFEFTLPKVVFFDVCDDEGSIRNMSFGQTATLVVGVHSDRPLETPSGRLSQSGRSIVAPLTDEPAWGEGITPDACTTDENSTDMEWYHFRIKVDTSFSDGPGKIVMNIRDVDRLPTSLTVEMMFQHAPTILGEFNSSTAMPGEDILVTLPVGDEDGLHTVICSFTIHDPSGTMLTQSAIMAGEEMYFESELSWIYPIPGSLANQTLTLEAGCLDEQGLRVTQTANITVGPQEACLNCTSDDSTQGESKQQDDARSLQTVALVGLLTLAIILGAVGFALRTNKNSTEELDWNVEEDTGHNVESLFDNDDLMDQTEAEPKQENPTESNTIPEGWTQEQYVQWLNGPTPEGWTTEQWADYVAEHTAKLDPHDIGTEG